MITPLIILNDSLESHSQQYYQRIEYLWLTKYIKIKYKERYDKVIKEIEYSDIIMEYCYINAILQD